MNEKKLNTKNKCDTAKNLGALQTINAAELWSHLLYLRVNGADWEQLAYWALMGKSFAGSLPEIRLTRITPTMLQLQYKSGRYGGGFLQENVKRNRTRKNGATGKRQTSRS